MKRQLFLGAWMFLANYGIVLGDTVTIDFDELSLGTNSFHDSSAFTSQGASFNNFFSGGYWEGWSYSNLTNVDTVLSGGENDFDDQNEMSAYHLPSGGGSSSANYAVAFTGGFVVTSPAVTLPPDYGPVSLRVTNNIYAAISMLHGDGFSKAFGGATGNDADWLLLTITGLNEDNPVATHDFYLADYRFENNALDYVVDEWTTINLPASFMTANKLTFAMSSTDNGEFGMNTPAYFVMDDLTLQSVPEPASATILLFGIATAGPYLRRRRQAAIQSKALVASRH